MEGMIEAKPSRTAMGVAIRRAAHQLFDTPLVLDDPFALPIVGPDAAERLQAAANDQQDLMSRAMRAFLVVRSRFAEDELARAIDRGTHQYVVLGAGLDTFAFRNPYPPDTLRVFEVDHPATQEWKRQKLTAADIAIPPTLTFAAVDFEHQTLADGLAQVGFDRHAPAFFSWLGVTMYLTEAAVMQTFEYVASTGSGGGIVFDYAKPEASLGWVERMALKALSKRVAAAGEPFQTAFDPAALQARLTTMGFRSIADLGAPELNARYFADSSDGLEVKGSIGRMLSATV
jgi:methyltransferase (TIGR00027 family)